jgi:signal transduction histidine kinase
VKKYILIAFFFALNTAYSQNKTEKKSIENQINKAGVSFNNGEYDKALNYSKSALVRSFKINDYHLIAQSYNAIGVVYDEFSQPKHAISFYNKALLYASRIENDSLNDWIYSNLGSVYYYSKIDVNKGIKFYKKSLEYAIKINDSVQITYTKLNIASAYLSLNDFENGISYINQTQDYIHRKGQNEMRFTLKSLLGTYNTKVNQPEKAVQYYTEAIAMAQQYKMNSFLINVYDNLAQHYKDYKQFDLEKQYREKSAALHKSTYSEDKQKVLYESIMQIQLDEYRVQLERIELENEKQQQKIKETNVITILFLVIFGVLLVLIFTLYRSNNFRRKSNFKLLQANAALKEAKEKAEEASLMKSQFVSTITHELRTPLYGVVGITDIITDEHKELADSPHLSSLKFSARYLLSLVNDILQLNKMDDKHTVLVNEVFNLSEEMETITNSVQYIAENNVNELTITIDKAIPKYLLGDKLRLSQIIMNLTSNALKFTRNGQVSIAMNQIDVKDNIHNIEFKITDTGVGIAPADQEKIFEMFVQVSRSDEDYQGTGLGLSIVKKIITLFGSKIHLESELNKGTKFTFTIGFEAAKVNEKAIITDEIDLNAHYLLKVLVVEDNKINQLVTQKIMDKNNIKSDMVADGFAALHLLETQKYDVILMDINMPIINGFETTKRIRSLGITTPIIALTAFDKEEIKEQVFASGMNDILIKPFEPAKLFEMIQQQVSATN